MSRASESSYLSSSLRAASSYLVSRCNVTLGLEGRFSDLPRDFKSLVSRAPDCDSGCLKGHGFVSRPVAMQQGFVTPRGHCPQQAVNTCTYPRINTHKPLRINTHKSCVIHALTLTKSRINTHKVWPAAQRTQGFWRASFIFFLYLFYLIDINPLFATPTR